MTIRAAASSRVRRAAFAWVVASFAVAQAVQACPGCKQAVGGDGAGGDHAVNGAGMAYALSIGFMLLTLASIMGTIGYMAYRNCQLIAAHQQAAYGLAGTSPAPGLDPAERPRTALPTRRVSGAWLAHWNPWKSKRWSSTATPSIPAI